MGVLDSILEYKRQKEAQANADIAAIPQGVNAFLQARETARKSALDEMLMNQNQKKIDADFLGTRVSAMSKGIEINPDGSLKFNKESPALESENLDNRLKRAQATMYENFAKGGSALDDNGNPVSQAKIPQGAYEGDYIRKPITRSLKGVPVQMEALEMKPPIPKGDFDDFKGLETIGLELEQNLRQLSQNEKSFEKYMGPMKIEAMRGDSFLGTLGNVGLKLANNPESREFLSFKAETDKAFQKFRDETTGAQAALKELGWLAPDLPEASDPPKLYAKKAKVALEKMAEGKKLLLDLFEQRGYRTGDIRAGLSERQGEGLDLSKMSEDELKKLAGL